MLPCNNDSILPVKEMQNTDLQRIVIFDDFVTKENQKPLIDYFIQGKNNYSVNCLTQSNYGCPDQSESAVIFVCTTFQAQESEM